jgi:hypothetical protein
MQYIAASIHNNGLARVIGAASEQDAKAMVRLMAEDQFGRPLTDDELDDLHNTGQIYNDSDADNVVTFDVGYVE